VWPDQFVEQQQLRQHCRAIVQAFASVISRQTANSLLEVRRGLGVRLTLEPEAVRII